MTNRIPAEVFPPGEYIKEELEARGWTQNDLAEIMGVYPRTISELVSARRGVTPETARGLGAAFGTSAQLWMNLESAYQLSKLDAPTDTVARRAKLYAKVPIKEIVKRHWIEETENIAVLERQVYDFYEVESLDEELVCEGVAARKSSDYAQQTPIETAWFCRAKRLAAAVSVQKYTRREWSSFVDHLKPLAENVEDARRIPPALAELGVRFLIVAPLTGSKIDGACFWLDEKSPVIALSLRIDHIDSLWFTLMHELAHVARGDAIKSPRLDIDLVGPTATKSENLPEEELEANRMAGEALIPRPELDNFILRTRPAFYRDRVEGFAKRMRVHPGIVNGQLHFHAGLGWQFNREFHAKVRQEITPAALTDGYGFTPPTLLPKRTETP